MAKPPEAEDEVKRDAKPLRVAYVTMLFPAGSETFASQDVRELLNKGIDIEVHSLRTPNGEEQALATNRGVADVRRTYNGLRATFRGLWAMAANPRRSVTSVWYMLRRSSNSCPQLFRTMALLPRAFDVFASFLPKPPDVVHVYWGHYPSMVGYLVQRFLPGTDVSMSLGAYDLEAHYPLSGDVARRAIFVRTHGQCNVQELVERVGVAPERVSVIYNGVDLANLPNQPLKLKRVPGRIVTASRLIPSKGVDDVITAFASIHRERPDATLEVFGDGADRSRLEALSATLGVSEAVSFRGHVAHHAVFSALSKAELFLFLSRDPTDRLPNVVKEAMGCGAVCIVSNTKGIDELIADPVRGRVVSMGDARAAAAAATSLLRDRVTADAVRLAAHDYLVNHFDLRVTTEAYVALWTLAASKHVILPGGQETRRNQAPSQDAF